MIPTYNQSKYITSAIDSVLQQTYNNIEIIVSDDSTNNLTEDIILQNYKEKVKYFHNKKPLGRVANYHHILYDLALGEWVVNLDGDDFFEDINFLKDAVRLIKKYPDISFVFAKQIIYKSDENKKIFSNINCNEYMDGNWLFINSIFKNIEIPHLATLYNRKKALEINFYDKNIISSDRESLLKLSLNNKVAFLNTNAGCWVHHGNNKSQNVKLEEILENTKMYDRLCAYAKVNTKLSSFKLSIWKLFAKYKALYVYMINTKQGSIRDNYLFLLKNNYLLFFLTLVDIRLYIRYFKND